MPPVEQLKKRAKLNTRPEQLPLKAWLETARKTTAQAEDFERKGDDEGAFVEWRKWAQIMDAVLKHPNYQQGRKDTSSDYVAFQSLKSRFGSSVQRIRDLEIKLSARDQAALDKTLVNGHHVEPVVSPSPNTSFASTNSSMLSSPPTSPPLPSSQPIMPDSPMRGRPISGGLASRMAALQVAGLDVKSPTPLHNPHSPPQPQPIEDQRPAVKPEASSVIKSPTLPHDELQNGQTSGPAGYKARRPLPPTPAGTSFVPLVNGRAPSPSHETVGSSRPASAPVIETPTNESILSSPLLPEPSRNILQAQVVHPQKTGLGFENGVFPSFSEFDSRFPDVPAALRPASPKPPASTSGLTRSPAMPALGSRTVLGDATNRTLEAESTKGHLSVDIPRSSYSRALPRTNYILPDALWQYLQPPPEDQPTMLLLDVRNREDYDRGHIEAPFCICLEPMTVSHEVQSDRLEASLVLSPSKERDAFLSRDRFDLVVLYDRDSNNIPPHLPSAGGSESARALYNLYTAVYEREYHRPLRRPPVILVGGYEAWSKFLIAKTASIAEASARLEAGGRSRQGTLSSVSSDTKRVNRKAAVVPSEEYSQQSFSRSGADAMNGSSYASQMPTGPLTRSHSSFSGQSPIASPPIAAIPSRQAGAPPAASFDYSPAPRQRTTIDYPQLSSIPQRPPLAAQPNGAPPRPSMPQVQRLSMHTDGKASDAPLTPISGAASLASLVKWGDGTVGMTGLKNLGNTCYMNSTLQCLSATIPLARFFKDGSYKRAINRNNPLGTRGALAEAVAQLFGVLWSEQYNFVSPVTFRDAICRFAPQFQGTDQHDSQEFLAFLLDGLHEDLNFVQQKPPPIPYTQEREAELEMLPPQIGGEREWNIYLRRENSVIVAWFQGQYRSQLKCLTCSKTSTTYNNFQYLTLALPSSRMMGSSKVNLESLLNAYVQEEVLDKDDAWNCPRCKVPRRASKKLSLVRLPPILIIHLKRFQFRGPFSDKIDTPVLFPLYGLDMSAYLPAPMTAAVQAQYAKVAPDAVPSAPTSNVYDLYAVSEQMGTLSSGHYTAKARSRDQWSEIGDSKVRKCDENDVRRSVKTAYILFYRRR